MCVGDWGQVWLVVDLLSFMVFRVMQVSVSSILINCVLGRYAKWSVQCVLWSVLVSIRHYWR